MTEPLSMDQAFIRKLTDIVLANLSDETFGAEKLAKEAGLSHSTVHRKLIAIVNKDITQFIKGIRLQHAFEMLQNNEGTVSEIAFRVGFSSPVYFTKCFHDVYGFPPGEMKRLALTIPDKNQVVRINKDKKLHGSELNKHIRPILKGLNNKSNPLILFGLLAGLTIIIISIVLIIKGVNQKRGPDSPLANKSIVVLPFVNLNYDRESQWFADGIIEDLRNHLSRISELRVISKTTSEYLSGKAMTLPEIAKVVNADYVLEGSISSDGNRVRIYVQLIDAQTDRHLISERFENEMTGIFQTQSDIAKKVADELETVITPGEIAQIEKISTKNTEAYNYYLQGRYYLNKRTSDGFTKSIGYFEKATAADPGYALAWAGLADAYFLVTFWEQYPNPDGFIKAKEYSLKALELDRDLAEAHAVRGGLLTYYEWNWEEARKEFHLAVELNSSFSFGHSYYSELLNILGENEEAREQINIALELDPFFYLFHYHSGGCFFNEERYKEALDEYQKSIELEPLSNPYTIMFTCYQMLDDNTNALKALNGWVKLLNIDVPYPDFLADIYNNSGEKGICDWMLELQLKQSEPSLWGLAFCFLKTGKKDEALDMLEKCFEEKTVHLPLINNTPDFDIIRKEPRFQAIIKKMGLSAYQKRLSANH